MQDSGRDGSVSKETKRASSVVDESYVDLVSTPETSSDEDRYVEPPRVLPRQLVAGRNGRNGSCHYFRLASRRPTGFQTNYGELDYRCIADLARDFYEHAQGE